MVLGTPAEASNKHEQHPTVTSQRKGTTSASGGKVEFELANHGIQFYVFAN